MIPPRARRRSPGLLCIPLCVACSILPAPEPVDIYLLPTTTVAPSAENNTPRAWSLHILRPEAGGQLVAQRILVVPEPNRMSVYKGASWHEPTPLLLRNRLFDAFRADARVNALSTDEMRTYADYELASDLNTFHSEYRQDGKAPEAVIRLDTRLIDASSRRIVASRMFEVRQAAADREIPAVVAAFGIAADRLAAELVDWVVARADATWRKTAAETMPVTPPQP